MTTENQIPPANVTETSNRLVSTALLGGFWRRQDIHENFVARYRILPFGVGLVLNVATDGTPWTRKGKSYHVACSKGWWRFACGKYALGILWRVPMPNPMMSDAPATPDKGRPSRIS